MCWFDAAQVGALAQLPLTLYHRNSLVNLKNRLQIGALTVGAFDRFQIASNSAHGPAQGLIPDLVPDGERGLAAGIKNLFNMLGLVVASLVAGQLMGSGAPTLAFAAIGAVVALSAAITLVARGEAPAGGPRSRVERPACSAVSQPRAALRGLRDLLNVDLRRHSSFAWLIASRFLILPGIYAVQGFSEYFIHGLLRLLRESGHILRSTARRGGGRLRGGSRLLAQPHSPVSVPQKTGSAPCCLARRHGNSEGHAI